MRKKKQHIDMEEVKSLLECFMRMKKYNNPHSNYFKETYKARAYWVLEDFAKNPYGYSLEELNLLRDFNRHLGDAEQKEEISQIIKQQTEYRQLQKINKEKNRYVLHKTHTSSNTKTSAIYVYTDPRNEKKRSRQTQKKQTSVFAALGAALTLAGNHLRQTGRNFINHAKPSVAKIELLAQKSKYIILGGILAAGGIFGFKQLSKTPNKQLPPIETQTTETPAPITQTPARTDSLQLKTAAIWNNYYDTQLEIQIGTQKKEKYYRQIENQLKKGVFSLPENISKQRLAFAAAMYEIYGVKSDLKTFMTTTTKLSAQQQSELEKQVLEIGSKAEKLQQRVITLAKESGRKINNASAFDRASPKLQRQHLKNLKQIRQLSAQR